MPKRDLASTIALFVRNRLPYERLQEAVQAHRGEAIALIFGQLPDAEGEPGMLLAQALGATETFAAAPPLLDLIVRTRKSMYVDYLKTLLERQKDISSPLKEELHQRGLACVRDADPQVRRAGCCILAVIPGPDAAPAIEPCLADPETAGDAIRAVKAQRDVRAVPVLRALFAKPTSRRRSSLLEALLASGPDDSALLLRHALRDQEDGVRRAAAWYLKDHPDNSLVTDLIDALVAEPQSVSRQFFISAIGRASHPAAGDALAIELTGPNPNDRAVACRGIGHLRDRRYTTSVMARLQDVEEQVRYAAGEALAELGDTSAVPALLAAEESWSVDLALGALATPEVVAMVETWLAGSRPQQQRAFRVLGAMTGDLPIQRLAKLLDEPRLRFDAALALLLHPHERGWRLALPHVRSATTEWRAGAQGWLTGYTRQQLGGAVSTARLAALNAAAQGAGFDVPPIGNVLRIPGTWRERLADGTFASWHVFTQDGLWLVYDNDADELEFDGRWNADNGPAEPLQLWNGVSFLTLRLHGNEATLVDPEGGRRETLLRTSDRVDVPPVPDV